MGESRICWDNEAFNADAFVDTTEDSGFPIENLQNWRATDICRVSGENTYEFEWEFGSAGITLSAFAISNHNMNTRGARYKLEGINDAGSSGSTPTSIIAFTTPGNDFTIVKFFSEVTFETIRLTIDNGGNSSDPAFTLDIGIVFLGDYLEMEHHPVPTVNPDGQQDFGQSSRGETGYLLGTVREHTMRMSNWKFDHLTPSWFDANWLPFWSAHRDKPFFWIWDSVTAPLEAYLMEFANKRLQAPWRATMYRNLSFSLRGRLEE